MGPRACQRGAALLLMMALLLGSTSWLLHRSLGARSASLEQQRKQITAQALQAAKSAVLAHAASAATPGQMPCPEDPKNVGQPAEGQASTCNNTKVHIGRLPWRSLGVGDLRDGNGDRLWYALGPGFRSAPINSNSTAGLALDGVAGAALAIVFSPGRASSGQNRVLPGVGRPLLVADYLDGVNASGNASFSTRENDVLLPISLADWLPAVEKRVLSEIARALWVHFCGISNWAQGGGCLTPIGGARALPFPAAPTDSGCLGTAAIANNSGKCPAVAGKPLGRIPVTLSPMWTDIDATSPLRGATGSASDWFQRNGWRELVFYSVASPCATGTANCSGTGSYLSLVQLQGAETPNLKGVILTAGTTLAGQLRNTPADKTSLVNYLEGGNLSGAQGRFTSGRDATRNDLGRGLK